MRGSRVLEQEDQAVRSTNDEATEGKWSAVNKGYYRDPFVEAFTSSSAGRGFHAPLMNRGHYARVMAVELTVLRFLAQIPSLPNRARQVVSLGCGFDTLYFRLASQGLLERSTRYFEVDFAQVVHRKRHILDHDVRFKEFLVGGQYALIECDLRDVDMLKAKLDEVGFSHDCPTIFLSECVLIYMTPEEGSRIISWSRETVPQSVFVTYEQIHPGDAFGKTMIRQLQSRNIPLHSILQYPSLAAQQQRYIDGGYSHSIAITMDNVYSSVIPLSDRRRVELIEMFDEYEEWRLVLSHYCLVVSCNGSAAQHEFISTLFKTTTT